MTGALNFLKEDVILSVNSNTSEAYGNASKSSMKSLQACRSKTITLLSIKGLLVLGNPYCTIIN